MAFYRLYRGSLASDHVWHHLFFCLGSHLCGHTETNGERSAPNNDRRPFLAGIDRAAVLYIPAYVWRHLKGGHVDGRQTLYRWGRAHGSLLAVAGSRRKPDVAFPFVLRL